MAHHIMSRYLSYSTMLADHFEGMLVLVCSAKYWESEILKEWHHDHGLTNIGAMVKIQTRQTIIIILQKKQYITRDLLLPKPQELTMTMMHRFHHWRVLWSAAAAVNVLRKLDGIVAGLEWPRPSCGSTSNCLWWTGAAGAAAGRSQQKSQWGLLKRLRNWTSFEETL